MSEEKTLSPSASVVTTRGNKYKSEEVSSKYGYFSGYKPGVMDLDRQIEALKLLFHGLVGANPKYLARVKAGEVPLSIGAEKFGAVPNWKECTNLFGANYNESLQKALGKIGETRKGKFHNYQSGEIGPDRLRQSARSIEFCDKLIAEQGNPDILIVPFQFGKRYAGHSVRRAREKFARTTEFGLGAFAVGCLLLTHSERLQHFDDLWIDCAGDEYDYPEADVRFSDAPCLRFYGRGVEFGTFDVSYVSDYFGSASGFFPAG